MKENKLSKNPQPIDEHNWYYEEHTGIVLVHEVIVPSGELLQTDQIKVPWKKLLESLERKYV